MDYSRMQELAAEQRARKQAMMGKFRRHIPSEMLEQNRWVRYFVKPKEDGQGTAKIPLANHSDPSTWSNFYNAFDGIENDQQGVGYCFYKGDIQGLDIDHCRNPKTGIICNEAMLLLSRLGSWAEYSVSGQGIHVLFKGNVRGKQLGETCLQFWNSKNSPRFFAMTCNMVGEAFTTLKDIGDDFNFVFAQAAHTSAKIREELKTVDYEQWLKLPAEREPVEQAREKAKHKTRKVAKDFHIYDFLKFYGLEIDNETDNDLGHCIRLTSCPIKGEKHVGQNGTSTNFIYPTKDGGLGFHCQSTGCVEYSVAQVIEHLATEKGTYPKSIYVHEKKQTIPARQKITIQRADNVKRETTKWLIPEFLPLCEVTAFSGEMDTRKSTQQLTLQPRVQLGKCGTKTHRRSQLFTQAQKIASHLLSSIALWQRVVT